LWHAAELLQPQLAQLSGFDRRHVCATTPWWYCQGVRRCNGRHQIDPAITIRVVGVYSSVARRVEGIRIPVAVRVEGIRMPVAVRVVAVYSSVARRVEGCGCMRHLWFR